MNLIINRIDPAGVRSGTLIFGKDKRLDTPCCFLYTRAGAVPDLCPDVLQDILNLPKAVTIPLPTVYETPGADVMKSFGKGIHKYVGLEDYLIYIPVQDSSKLYSFSYNAQKNVSLWTASGRKKLTVDDHVRTIEAFSPDVVQCMCDTVPINSDGLTTKRIKKSVDRTLQFLDETLSAAEKSVLLSNVALLGVIEGGAIVEERKRSAKETIKRPLAGYVIEGLNEDVESSIIKEILTCVMEILPEDKPKFVSGIETPGQILLAVESGIDVFDGVYPH